MEGPARLWRIWRGELKSATLGRPSLLCTCVFRPHSGEGLEPRLMFNHMVNCCRSSKHSGKAVLIFLLQKG